MLPGVNNGLTFILRLVLHNKSLLTKTATARKTKGMVLVGGRIKVTLAMQMQSIAIYVEMQFDTKVSKCYFHTNQSILPDHTSESLPLSESVSSSVSSSLVSLSWR